jgi:anti-anti-sigma regulatory factor
VSSAGGLVPAAHLGWGYTDRGQFLTGAEDFMADGIAAGQWVDYVGSGDLADLRRDVARFQGGAKALAANGVGVCRVEDFFEFSGGTVDATASMEARVAACKAATAVDAAAVALTPSARDAYARYEYLLDRAMADAPISALCAYDVGRLGPAAVAEMAALHPLVNPQASRIRVYKASSADFGLAGEIDIACHAQFDMVLGRVLDLAEEHPVRVSIDASELTFVDHRGLLLLDRQAAACGRKIILRSPSGVVRRLAEWLELAHVEVVAG